MPIKSAFKSAGKSARKSAGIQWSAALTESDDPATPPDAAAAAPGRTAIPTPTVTPGTLPRVRAQARLDIANSLRGRCSLPADPAAAELVRRVYCEEGAEALELDLTGLSREEVQSVQALDTWGAHAWGSVGITSVLLDETLRQDQAIANGFGNFPSLERIDWKARESAGGPLQGLRLTERADADAADEQIQRLLDKVERSAIVANRSAGEHSVNKLVQLAAKLPDQEASALVAKLYDVVARDRGNWLLDVITQSILALPDAVADSRRKKVMLMAATADGPFLARVAATGFKGVMNPTQVYMLSRHLALILDSAVLSEDHKREICVSLAHGQKRRLTRADRAAIRAGQRSETAVRPMTAPELAVDSGFEGVAITLLHAVCVSQGLSPHTRHTLLLEQFGVDPMTIPAGSHEEWVTVIHRFCDAIPQEVRDAAKEVPLIIAVPPPPGARSRHDILHEKRAPLRDASDLVQLIKTELTRQNRPAVQVLLAQLVAASAPLEFDQQVKGIMCELLYLAGRRGHDWLMSDIVRTVLDAPAAVASPLRKKIMLMAVWNKPGPFLSVAADDGLGLYQWRDAHYETLRTYLGLILDSPVFTDDDKREICASLRNDGAPNDDGTPNHPAAQRAKTSGAFWVAVAILDSISGSALPPAFQFQLSQDCGIDADEVLVKFEYHAPAECAAAKARVQALRPYFLALEAEVSPTALMHVAGTA